MPASGPLGKAAHALFMTSLACRDNKTDVERWYETFKSNCTGIGACICAPNWGCLGCMVT